MKISGPILDRIDLHVEVPALSYQALTGKTSSENSAAIRERILECRKIQAQRYRDKPFNTNALMQPRDIKHVATPSAEGRRLMEAAMKDLHLSARAYYKILKIARTLADLDKKNAIEVEHIAEAIQYRSLDRQWG